MPKRPLPLELELELDLEHNPDSDSSSLPKRSRTCFHPSDPLSSLSDEILLRTFSFLPVAQLAICERLSHRFKALATDSQLWKSAYYDRFVRPRAARIPGVRTHGAPATSLHFSSRISKWLDDDYLVRRGKETDWKRQYRLRHNWSRGICNISETRVADRKSVPPLLVRFHGAILITVDSAAGLRAWSTKGENRLLATLAVSSYPTRTVANPTAMAIDTSNTNVGTISIAVGFSDGGLTVYYFCVERQVFLRRYANIPVSSGAVEAVAYASPHLLMMTDTKLLSLYHVDPHSDTRERRAEQPLPRLLASLKSHTAWPPFSLTLRASSSTILASVAYAMPTYLAGWSVGLQELRLTSDGNLMESRLTSAVGHGFTPLYDPPSPSTARTDSSSPNERLQESNPLFTKPTSLSYHHPYILAAHPDNTLTFYMVTSDASHLAIGPGCRLWGHTSSVSGAHVGDRGKAVSVSRYGNDVRVWELESGLCHGKSKRHTTDSGKSVRIRPEVNVLQPSHSAENLGFKGNRGGDHVSAQESHAKELAKKNGWVAFDDEKVLLLQEEEGEGAQMVVVYDFS